MERCERNAEIRKLAFLNCLSLYGSDVEHLREIVDVEWDELEQTYQSDTEEDLIWTTTTWNSLGMDDWELEYAAMSTF